MKREYTAYIFVLPFFVIFTYFYFIPIFKVIGDSFTDFDMFTKRNFVGMENYRDLLQDEAFLLSIKNTLVYAVATLFPALAIALGLSMIINSPLIKTRFTRMFIFMPHVISMVAVSMIWLYLYEPGSGIFNIILAKLGLSKKQWLLDPGLALPCIIVMDIWKKSGYYMVIFLSGLKAIPEEYYEAAKMDGSSGFNTFLKITFPLLKDTSSFLLITGMISCFNVFEQVNILTKGGPLYRTTTLVHQIYTTGFTRYELGYASAMSVVLLLIVGTISAVNFRLTRTEE